MDSSPQRIVMPRLEALPHLRSAASPGLEEVVRFFHARLPLAWEIYVRPHFNGLSPDVVLLNPEVGLAVYRLVEYPIWEGGYAFRRDSPGSPLTLYVQDEAGAVPVINPFAALRSTRENVAELYIPTVRREWGSVGFGAVTAGLIFPYASEEEVTRFCADAAFQPHRYAPAVSREALARERVHRVFPESGRSRSKLMSETAAAELRAWLREPEYRAAQRQPLVFDPVQKPLVSTRTRSGLRRIRGAAGTGKTHVIAGRAAHLEAQGRRVLVLTFNNALIRYIRDLVDRARAPYCRDERVTVLGFHAWCKLICEQAGFTESYRALWRHHKPDEQRTEEGRQVALKHVCDEELPRLTERALETLDRLGGHRHTGYDALLVDEGQDWSPHWWHVARRAIRNGGEFILAADATQDLYGRAESWTDEAMSGAGFRGKWSELYTCHRLPGDYLPFVSEFASRVLSHKEGDQIPGTRPLQLHAPTQMRWRQVPGGRVPQYGALAVAELEPVAREDPAAYSDVVVVVPTRSLGVELVTHLEHLGINTVHTLQQDSRAASAAKRGFSVGNNGVKVTTMHGMKGWEARYLVVCVEAAESEKVRRALYVALTRLKVSETGVCSYVAVVTSDPQLRQYGCDWPVFIDETGVAGSGASA
ncbi:hypothetical protein KBTX_02390 [wastewater metagenome]|uniref:UvrD-like helicase ATP-binding domain-containing protein n=3 Tax=root TaxID=1 RepID=A0A5B8RBP8_9ZZZZ|nr:hypothetical protein KBTEX_02390 [uncultured organism]